MIEQKFYKDQNNKVYCITSNSNESYTDLILEDWVEIPKDEAITISNPPLTQQELDAQKEAENIAHLVSESERTENEIKIYERMRDRNRADADDLAMLESIDLKKVTKQKGWPLEVDWPIAPEF